MNEPSPAESAEARRHRRRLIGLVMIFTAIVLVLLGQLVLDAYLKGMSFILYWGACSLFVALALFAALVDMVAVRRDAAREEKRLVRETLGRVKHGTSARREMPEGADDKE